MSHLKAFQIKIGSKLLDYRLSRQLNLKQVQLFFKKNYSVNKLWVGGRHILGLLEKNNQSLFLKLSTTEGISALTKNEYLWNEQFNKLIPRNLSKFWVPENKDCGIYKENLFYLITDNLNGQLLTNTPTKSKSSSILLKNINLIIEFSESIKKLKLVNLSIEENSNFKDSFLEKTNSWYNTIPENIRLQYKINDLLKLVTNNIPNLQSKPRHGDFTPWHLMELKNGQLGLIDGEHAKKNSVEYYDIGYFIQRVFTILQNSTLSIRILNQLIKRGYDLEKLRVILAARAIGGFVDESLRPNPNYEINNNFKSWIINNLS